MDPKNFLVLGTPVQHEVQFGGSMIDAAVATPNPDDSRALSYVSTDLKGFRNSFLHNPVWYSEVRVCFRLREATRKAVHSVLRKTRYAAITEPMTAIRTETIRPMFQVELMIGWPALRRRMRFEC